MRRSPVIALGVAVLFACAEPASSSGPGEWTTVEGPKLIAGHLAAVRGQDGTLSVAFTDVDGDLAVSRLGADGTRLSTEPAIADGGTTSNAIVRDPGTGQLRVLYGGFRNPPGESGTWSATAPATGTPWSAPSKIGNMASALQVATTSPDGTLYVGRPDPPTVHRGTDPSDPDHSYGATSGQDAGIATDPVSGAPFLGWMNPDGPDWRLTVRQGSASTGAPAGAALEAPGLGGAPADAVPGHAVPLGGRAGGGIHTAYVDSGNQGELLLWRVGDALPRQVATIDGRITLPALAPAQDGSLWIVWFEDVALTADKIAARRLLPDGTTLGPVTRLDVPSTSGLFPAEIVAVAQAGKLDVLATDTAKHIWHTQVTAPPSGGPAPTTGALSGRVSQRDGSAVPAALVEACPQPSGLCLSVYTDADGRYRFDALPAAGYVVTARPPRGRILSVTTRDGASTVPAGGELSGQDLVMREPIRRPANVGVFGPGLVGEFDGVPRVVRGRPLMFVVDIADDLEQRGLALDQVRGVNLQLFDEGPGTIAPPFTVAPFAGPLEMTALGARPFCAVFAAACRQLAESPLPPGRLPSGFDLDGQAGARQAQSMCQSCSVFGLQVPAQHLNKARGDRWAACSEIVFKAGGTVFDCWYMWIDPSGYVRTTRGRGLPGARVVLFRSAAATGPFTQVEDGSAEMSPSNRKNPDVTDATGHFGWDVVSGYYKVRATHNGCTSPADRRQRFVETRVYEIPPPVTDIDLRMRCPAPPARKAKPRLTRLGSRLTCLKGKWRNKPRRFQYQWRRGRVPLLEQRARRYRVTRADRRQKLSCKVYATNAYGTGVAISKSVRIR